MTQQGIYTKEDLLAHATRKGFKVSARLVDDWVQAGLLGNAEDQNWPGRTHGSGSTVKWSQHQLDLFLMLLYGRQKENIRENGPLCNIPLWIWVYWGDLGGITLKQARRAMHTWVEFWRGHSQKILHRSARNLVALASHPRGTQKRSLIKELTRIGTSGAYYDDEILRYLLNEVIGPKAKGPEHAKLSSDYIVSMLSIRALAMRNIQEVLMQPDLMWEWARVSLLYSYTIYQKQQPIFAADPDLGHRFPQMAIHSLSETSCYYLFTLLGIAHQELSTANTPDFLHPQIWKKGAVTTAIRTQVTPSALLLPDGSSSSCLEHLITTHYLGRVSTFRCHIPLQEKHL